MKRLLTLVILSWLGTQARAQYNDTLYYKSGQVKPVTIRQHDEKFVTYEYRNKKGKLVDAKISISSLKSFVVYDEYGKIVFNSAQPAKKEE